MDYSEIREIIREDVRDLSSVAFTDSELDSFIDAGQAEYCRHTGALSGEAELVCPAYDLPFRCPSDFLRKGRILNLSGDEVSEISWRDAMKTGVLDMTPMRNANPFFVCWDMENDGEFSLFPRPMDGEKCGVLHYKRLPRAGVLEITDVDAVKDYATFRALAVTGTGVAINFLNSFLKNIANYNAVRKSMFQRQDRREGIWF